MSISSRQQKSKRETTSSGQQDVRGSQAQSTSLALQRAYADPASLTPADVQTLQRTVGNRATTQLLRPVLQRQELTLGPANDQYEQEADHVAAQVVRQIDSMPAGTTNRSRVQRENLEEELVQATRFANGLTPVRRTLQRVQHAPLVRRAEEAPPTHGPEGGAVEESVQQQIQAARGGGQSLPDEVRGQMEQGFGTDFSGVRIHTGSQADTLSRSLNARAFTVGSDVFFKQGEYNPGSSSGKKLLAHELTHTVQQGAAGVQRKGLSAKDGRRQPLATKRPPTNPGSLQRMAYSDLPSTWTPTKVSRSGEGVAGVYFVKEGSDMVVVKPMSSDEAAGTEFANHTMEKTLNLEAPQTVTYAKSSTEGGAIANLLLSNADTIETESGKIGQVSEQVNGAAYFMVMSAVKGKSIQTLDDDGAEDFITNAEALKGVGRIMVGDAFLGNGDRLILTQNLGNFFYDVARGMVATIDNDMSVGGYSIGNSGKLGGDLDNRRYTINALMDPSTREMYIRAFIKKFRTIHTNQGHAKAAAAIDDDFIINNVGTGITEGFRDMAKAFTDNIDLVRSIGSTNAKYGDNRNKRNYDSVKGLAHYVKARDGGESDKNATEKLRKYVEYRAKRNKISKGFKWWAKLTNKTGF